MIRSKSGQFSVSWSADKIDLKNDWTDSCANKGGYVMEQTDCGAQIPTAALQILQTLTERV